MRSRRLSGGRRILISYLLGLNPPQPKTSSGGTAVRRGLTPTTTIRLDPTDISRAKIQAERRGLKYQTYLKMLIHRALAQEESDVNDEGMKRRA